MDGSEILKLVAFLSQEKFEQSKLVAFLVAFFFLVLGHLELVLELCKVLNRMMSYDTNWHCQIFEAKFHRERNG